MRIRYFKGNIGDLAIAGLICSVFLAMFIIGVGGIAVNNNVPLPGAVNTLYVALNSTGGLGGTNFTTGARNLSQLAQTTGNGEKNQSFFNQVTSVFNTVNLVSNFIGAIPSLFFGFINFITGGLFYIGVPTAFVTMVTWAIIMLIIVLIILSALFIFPLIRGG